MEVELKFDKQVILNRRSFKYLSFSPPLLFAKEWWLDLQSCMGKSACMSRMHMLRWMCRPTKSDKIWNEATQDSVGVTSMMDKMTEERFRCSSM